ncbi:MAG: lytic transglycosylase [Paracoccaceae bacterium]
MRFFVLLLVLILGSCVGSSGPPKNQTDACSILDQKRGWLKDLQRSESAWGVPVHVQMATIWRESNYQRRAKTSKKYFLWVIPNGRVSSAYGYGQALDGTWDWYRDETGNHRAKRTDFGDTADFIGWYMNVSNRRLGIEKNDAFNQYLAYHEGHTGYSRGSYASKAWLKGAANEVQAMASRYESQLQYCT